MYRVRAAQFIARDARFHIFLIVIIGNELPGGRDTSGPYDPQFKDFQGATDGSTSGRIFRT